MTREQIVSAAVAELRSKPGGFDFAGLVRALAERGDCVCHPKTATAALQSMIDVGLVFVNAAFLLQMTDEEESAVAQEHTTTTTTKEPTLQFFAYEHLPPALRAVSQPFGDLARSLVATLPRNPERTAALRFLLQAKDCAVRASIYED